MTRPTNALAGALLVNDDTHWHRGPSASCRICTFAASQGTQKAGLPPEVNVEMVAKAILSEFPHLAMSDRPLADAFARIAAEYARLREGGEG